MFLSLLQASHDLCKFYSWLVGRFIHLIIQHMIEKELTLLIIILAAILEEGVCWKDYSDIRAGKYLSTQAVWMSTIRPP